MLQPETHRDLVEQRHSDMLKAARAGELAQRLGAARLEERRSFLARFTARRDAYQASTAAPSNRPC